MFYSQSRISLFVVFWFALAAIGIARAEIPVQQSWQCQAGDVLVVSNTPCQAGAQPVSAATSVIYHCQRNGVSSFQQSPCSGNEAAVHLYRDVRTPEVVASGKQVRSSVLAQAKAARSAQAAREGSDSVTVVGSPAKAAVAYRTPNRAPKGNSGY